MMTLFLESPTSPTTCMALHSLKILRAATKYLNPNQTPCYGCGSTTFFRWPRNSNGNFFKQNLVKILSWSYGAMHTEIEYRSWSDVVVVVDHCFTSLFGPTVFLSDIVIR